MKLSRAWPEFSTKSNVVDTTIGESKSDEVFPKTVVVQKVHDALQENINKLVKEIVIEQQEDPEPVRPETAKPSKVTKVAKKSSKKSSSRKTVVKHDIWIAFSVVSVLFIILLTTLFNRISFLEKMILELKQVA